MAQLKDLLVTGDSRFVGNVYSDAPKIAYGTCATAAATAAKEIVVDDPTWNLQVGDIIGIKFTNSNTASNVTFNINGTGAIGVSYNTSRPYTGNSTQVCGYANRTLFYQYDGTYWHWFHGGYDANDNTYTSAYCSTGAGTAAKVATCTNYNLLAKSYLHIIMTTTNTVQGALTLNVNSKGAKPIYINGAASSASNYTLPAGSYVIYYDGTNYYFRTDGKIENSGTTVGVTQKLTAGTEIGTITVDGTATKLYAPASSASISYSLSKSGGTVTLSGTDSSTSSVTLSASDVGAIATTAKNVANGVAGLDANGKVASAQLPSYVDDVLEYSAKASFPTTGETGKIYVDTSTNKTYRWGGSAYVEISASLALGTTSSTAYRGDYGNTAYTHATDSSRLTTATTSGLYKVASTAHGHIASLTAVQKADITNLGVPSSDTKNTAGSTDSSSKLFLIGATSQAANPQTYSQDTAYVGTDGHLYSNGVQVVNLSGSQALTNKTYNGYTLAAASAKAVDTSIAAASTSANLPTSAAVAAFVEGKGYKTTDNDTKNTAGSTNSSSKLFIIGATSQAASPQTYSQDTTYIGTDGHLYSNSKQVVNLSDTQALTNKTYNGYTLAAASAKGVDTSITSSSSSTNLPTTAAVVSYVPMTYSGTAAPDNTIGKNGDIYIMI